MDLGKTPEMIETSRLHIRRLEPSFAARIFARIDSERERLRQYLYWVDNTKDESDTLKFIEYSVQAWKENREFNYSIFLKDTDDLIGAFGAIVSKENTVELGYWISQSFESKGLILEAVEAMTQVFFSLGFPRVEIRCGLSNLKSENVAIRAGFKFDRVIPNLEMGPNCFRDTKVFYRLSPHFLSHS